MNWLPAVIWGVAREWAFIRATLLEIRADVLESIKTSRNLERFKRPGWYDKLSRIQSIGYTADVLVRGSILEPGTIWQSINPRKRKGKIPPVSEPLSKIAASFR